MTADKRTVRVRSVPLPVEDISEPVIPILITIAKSTRALLGIRLAEIGFHNGQDEFLLALEENTLVCISALSERVSVRPSTVSKMMDRLAEKQLVERVADGKDSRRTMVRITPSGVAARALIQKVHDRVEKDLVSDVDSKEVEAMRYGLMAAQERLTARLIRLR